MTMTTTTGIEESTGRKSHVHVLVFPFPAQGHMIPILELAHELSTHGLAITVLVTPDNLPLLSPLLSRSPSIQTLVLPFPSHPSLPPGVENSKDLPNSSLFHMITAISALYDPLLRWFRSTSDPPHVIVSDFFLGWTQRLAADLGIPRLNFSPSSAYTLAVIHTLWREMPNWTAGEDFSPLAFPGVPNSPAYPWWQVSPIYRRYRELREGEPALDCSVKDSFLANLDSWGFVVNSFEALDGAYLEYLREEELGHRRPVFAVGPLRGERRGGGEAEDVFRWLDTCPEGSVVYVCFGSQVELSEQQAEAIASALEGSGVRFVWVIKGGELPAVAFEEKMRGRGVVVRGWAPQVGLLRHAAVGAFVSHCGWNSVVEAVVEGVVVLAWPMGADQYINARVLVEEKGMAVRVCEGKDAVPEVEELTRVLRLAVGGGEGGGSSLSEVRKRAQEMRIAAERAVAEGGSSAVHLEELAVQLSKLGRGK